MTSRIQDCEGDLALQYEYLWFHIHSKNGFTINLGEFVCRYLIEPNKNAESLNQPFKAKQIISVHKSTKKYQNLFFHH